VNQLIRLRRIDKGQWTINRGNGDGDSDGESDEKGGEK